MLLLLGQLGHGRGQRRAVRVQPHPLARLVERRVQRPAHVEHGAAPRLRPLVDVTHHAQLRRLLSGSDAVVSLWRGKRLVGFGRATSDGFSRAVLWDIVVAGDLQGHGLGRRVIEELLHTPPVVGVERVYLMTTKSAGFYRQLGFQDANPQQLMVLRR